MNNIDRIDRYLSGAMEAEEKQQFELDLATDAQLAEDLALQRDMAVFLKNKTQRSALKSQLRGIGEEYFKAPEQPAKVVQMPPRRRWLWASAAAAAIVLLLVWQFLLSPTLYEQYAQYPPLALAEKASTANDWSQAETAFNTGDYATAETQLSEYLEQYPNDQLARLYLGICKMEQNQSTEAQQIFSNFATADASIRDYADWYLALNYLKSEDLQACREALQKIAPSSAFQAQAQDLLGRLK